MTKLYQCNFCKSAPVIHNPHSDKYLVVTNDGTCICCECVEMVKDIIGKRRKNMVQLRWIEYTAPSTGPDDLPRIEKVLQYRNNEDGYDEGGWPIKLKWIDVPTEEEV